MSPTKNSRRLRCRCCDEEFTPTARYQLYCGKECSKAAGLRRRADWQKEWRKRNPKPRRGNPGRPPGGRWGRAAERIDHALSLMADGEVMTPGPEFDEVYGALAEAAALFRAQAIHNSKLNRRDSE